MELFKIQIASVVSVLFPITVLVSHSMDVVDPGLPDYARASTALLALSEGTSILGPMSRNKKDNELDRFERRHADKPTALPVALDVLAVYVHRDNPRSGISVPRGDAILSATRKCGCQNDMTTLAELGLSGEWATRPIQLYGQNSVSATYSYFKSKGVCKE